MVAHDRMLAGHRAPEGTGSCRAAARGRRRVNRCSGRTGGAKISTSSRTASPVQPQLPGGPVPAVPRAGPPSPVPCRTGTSRMPFSRPTTSRPSKEPRMNRYGLMAQKHWAQWLPARYVQIEDPDSFFSDLGRLTAERIDSLALDLAGDDQPGEGYLGKAGRLGQARRQAEEVILAELILLDPEAGASQESENPATDLPRTESG